MKKTEKQQEIKVCRNCMYWRCGSHDGQSFGNGKCCNPIRLHFGKPISTSENDVCYGWENYNE